MHSFNQPIEFIRAIFRKKLVIQHTILHKLICIKYIKEDPNLVKGEGGKKPVGHAQYQ